MSIISLLNDLIDYYSQKVKAISNKNLGCHLIKILLGEVMANNLGNGDVLVHSAILASKICKLLSFGIHDNFDKFITGYKYRREYKVIICSKLATVAGDDYYITVINKLSNKLSQQVPHYLYPYYRSLEFIITWINKNHKFDEQEIGIIMYILHHLSDIDDIITPNKMILNVNGLPDDNLKFDGLYRVYIDGKYQNVRFCKETDYILPSNKCHM